jgi:hypothetical protein
MRPLNRNQNKRRVEMRNAPAWSAARRIAPWAPAAAVPVWDAQRGNYEHAYRTLSTGECLLCIEELSAKARPAWYRPDGINEALAIMRKIAAVAVQAMENHGVIPR